MGNSHNTPPLPGPGETSAFLESVRWQTIPQSPDHSPLMTRIAVAPFQPLLDERRAQHLFGVDGPIIGIVKVGNEYLSPLDLLVDRSSAEDPASLGIEIIRPGNVPMNLLEFWDYALPVGLKSRVMLRPGEEVMRSSEDGEDQVSVHLSSDHGALYVSTSSSASVATLPEQEVQATDRNWFFSTVVGAIRRLARSTTGPNSI